MPWKAHRSQCERETPHVLLPTVARNALAGQGESVCVLQVAFIQAICFYSTKWYLITLFCGVLFSVLELGGASFNNSLSKNSADRKKKKKKGWVVLCMCPLWHHKGCDSRTRRKKREKQTKRRLTGCSWLFYLFMCLSIYIFLYCFAPCNRSMKWNQLNSF